METNFIARSWWSFLLRGLLAIAFGIILLAWPGATLLVVLILFGIFILVDGIIEVILAIASASKKYRWGWILVKGLVAILIGIVVLARPGVALAVLVVLMAIWAIATGFVELIAAFEMPPESGRSIVGFSGLLSIAVGILLLVVPWGAVHAFIIIIAVLALVLGILGVILSFFARSWEKKAEA